MDGETTPAKSLEERVAEAAQRQYRAGKTLEMAPVKTGADFMGIVARQRVIKDLLIRAGIVSDHDGIVATREDAPVLWHVLEEEAKAAVLEDLVDVAMGKPNDRAKPVVLKTFGGDQPKRADS